MTLPGTFINPIAQRERDGASSHPLTFNLEIDQRTSGKNTEAKDDY